MSDIPLTEAVIHQNASALSFQRGLNYFNSGAVIYLPRRGNQITAEVEGSDFDPYMVSVTFDQTGLQSTDCSCPYDWGSNCKHIVAVLLAVIHSPDKVDERASFENLLSGLREDELSKVLLSLAENHPGLVDEIEGLIQIQGQLRTSKPAGAESGPKVVVVPYKRQTPLDPEPFRRQGRRILKSAYRYNRYEDYGFDVAQAAAIQGWNSPQMVRVLKGGEITRKGVWEGEVPWYADDLAVARLNVLGRQGRIQEYLNLAEAEGQTELHLTMLAKSGRTAEATESGLKYATTNSEALALAKALQEQGESESALRIGEHMV